jgi:CDGSH-type Zn-finger protein
MTRIKPRRRGPLAVEGDFELYGLDGERIDLGDRRKVLLCRCGHTKSAPICDGSHYRVPFEAEDSGGE